MKNKIVYFVILIFLAITCMSFLYTLNFIKNNDKQVIRIIKEVPITINYNYGKIITINNFNFSDYSYEFYIENSSDYETYYDLYLNVISTPFDKNNKNFTYKITSTYEKKNKDDVMINISTSSVPIKSIKLGSGKITNTQKHFYKMDIKYNMNNINSINTKPFISYISIEKGKSD